MLEQSKVAETFLASRTRARSVLFRPIVDAVAIFSILCLVGMSCGSAPSSASPHIPASTASYAMSAASTAQKAVAHSDFRPVVEIATTSSPDNPDAVFRRTSAHTAWALLMASLSVIIALNLALFRHMRRAYARPRRRNSVG